MKKLILLLVVLMTVNISSPAQNINLPEQDKLTHFIVGAGLADIGYITTYKLTENKKAATAMSIVLPIVAGFTKEVLDSSRGGKFDKKDFLYTAAGGFTVTISFNLVLPKKKFKRK